MDEKYKYLKQFGLILFGSFLISIALEGFLLVNNLAFGGVGGLSLILEEVLNIPNSRRIIFWLISFLMLIAVGYKKGEVFLYKTFCAFSMVSFGLPTVVDWLEGTMHIYPFQMFTQLPLELSAILGGVILGIGATFIIKEEGSTSGPDTFAYIVIPSLKKFFKKRGITLTDAVLVPVIMVAFDIVVYTWGLVVFGINVWQGVFTIFVIPTTIGLNMKFLVNQQIKREKNWNTKVFLK